MIRPHRNCCGVAPRISTSDWPTSPQLRIDLLHIIGKTQLERGLIEDAVGSLDRAISSLDATSAHPRSAPPFWQLEAWRPMNRATTPSRSVFLEQARSAAHRQSSSPDIRQEIDIQLADMLVVDGQAERALQLTGAVLDEQIEPARRAEALRVRGAALEISDRLDEAERHLTEALVDSARD